MKKKCSYLIENKKFFTIVLVSYIVILVGIWILELIKWISLPDLFRPIEIMSAFLSILIIKEVSEIRRDYIGIAESERHDKAKKFKEELRFFTLYKKRENTLKRIEDCETPDLMKKMGTELKIIQPLLVMFKDSIIYLYDEKAINRHKENYDVYEKSIDFFEKYEKEPPNEETTDREKSDLDNYYKNNINLIVDVITCIENNFENREDIVAGYEKSYESNTKEEKKQSYQEVDDLNDEDLD